MKPNLPIECRAKPNLWWCVLCGSLLSIFLLVSPFFVYSMEPKPPQNSWWLFVLTGGMALFMGFCALSMALDLKRGVIRADENGLTWRFAFSGPKSARWEEITDYYRGSSNSRVIVTPAGKLELTTTFDGIDKIADLVIEKTPHIENLGWELKRMRVKGDKSQTFTPLSGEHVWGAPFMSGLMIMLIILLTVPFLNSFNQQSLGFWLDTLPRIIGVIFGGTLIGGYAWCLRGLWRERQFAVNHRHEKLVLDAQGLVFTSPERHFEARWTEIEKISVLPKVNGIAPVQAETASQQFIIWHIAEWSLWRRIESILDQYAAHALKEHTTREQLLLLCEDLEGERGARSGNARRWSFRTRTTRLILLVASFVLLFMPVVYPMGVYSAHDEGPFTISWPLFAGLYVISGLIMGAGWLWYYRSETLADEYGLKIRSPFHREYHVSWADIEDVGTDAFGEFVRTKKRKFYLSRTFKPVRTEELREYILSTIKTS